MKPQSTSACRECGEPTNALALWDGKVVSLCTKCGEAIRKAEPQKVEKAA